MSVNIDDDIEFETLLADKRHKELKGLLKALVTRLESNDNAEVVSAIQSQTKVIEHFTEAIKDLPVPADVDLSPIKQMGDSILKGFKEVRDELNKPKPKTEWLFEIKRGFGNLIESVTAKQLK